MPGSKERPHESAWLESDLSQELLLMSVLINVIVSLGHLNNSIAQSLIKFTRQWLT